MVIFSQLVKVLIADTDIAFAQKLSRLVSASDIYSVCSVTNNGSDALRDALAYRPDILLLSLTLPYTDGFGVIEEFRRELPQHRHSIIAFTNEINSFIFAKASSMDIDYLFTKPISELTFKKRFDGLARNLVSVKSVWSKGVSPSSILRDAGRERDRLITEYLNGVRIYPNLTGYHYLRDAISMAIDDAGVVKRMTTHLYPTLAAQYITTACAVERSIRGAIERSFRRADVASLYDLFGYTVDEERGKPTNSQFIALLADRIKTELSFIE